MFICKRVAILLGTFGEVQMTDTKMDATATSTAAHRLSVSRLAATGGVTAALVMVFCWVGAFIPFSSPTHAYIELFTAADIQSVAALGEGSLWSLLFGALSGSIFAAVYNLFASLDRP
jgi:uncharacterized protein YqgC (DUF456 family)